jgi:hypothetical protein
LSSSCRARIEAEGSSGGREMFSTVVVASLCRSVGRRSRRWSHVGVGNGKRTWRRRGLSWRAAPWTPIAGVGAERSRPAGCRSWEAGFMPPAGGQWVSAAHHCKTVCCATSKKNAAEKCCKKNAAFLAVRGHTHIGIECQCRGCRCPRCRVRRRGRLRRRTRLPMRERARRGHLERESAPRAPVSRARVRHRPPATGSRNQSQSTRLGKESVPRQHA